MMHPLPQEWTALAVIPRRGGKQKCGETAKEKRKCDYCWKSGRTRDNTEATWTTFVWTCRKEYHIQSP